MSKKIDVVDTGNVKAYLLDLQQRICAALETEEADRHFEQDSWQHASGGGGQSRVLQNGTVFEQAGVNFSHVLGDELPAAASAARPHLAGRRFEALGVSLVIHPRNPYVPTSHMNVRFFVATNDNSEPIWWFGGGFDLTPYYPFKPDVVSLASHGPGRMRNVWRRHLPAL